jgi:predicted phage tail protein
MEADLKVTLSGVLQKHTQYQREHSFEVDTVQGAVDALVVKYPNLKKMLNDPAGQLRCAHTLFLNGEHLAADQLDRALRPSDNLQILTAIAGG